MPPADSVTELAIRPITEYVLKVASRCNLACDHCYVYGDPGQGWLSRPSVLDPATTAVVGKRIAEHAERHALSRVVVFLHGGEPLLLGSARLGPVLSELRAQIDPITELDLRLQTNGTLLTPSLCDLLATYHVSVGISLDGDRLANDRHRRHAHGGSSHDEVLRALTLLRTPPYRALYGGILCTIDVENDPLHVYEALLREQPPRIDFLLPHATWESPPPGRDGQPGRYARWLLSIYDRWMADDRPVPIRTFDSILSLERGGVSGTESLGTSDLTVAVIETDGTWEQPDSLKIVSEQAPHTGLDVWRQSVDDLIAHLGAMSGRIDGVPKACRSCPVRNTCGGGLYAHRFARRNGFDNPSVYCSDLFQLITGVRDRELSNGPHPEVHVRDNDPHGETSARQPRRLSDADLRELAMELHPPALDRVLVGQYGIDRELLVETAAAAGAGLGAEAWSLLVELDTHAPDAVRSALSYPYVRARARRVLSAASGTDPRRSASALAAVALTAAVRAAYPASLDVPLDGGVLCLPGIGVLPLPGAHTATVSWVDVDEIRVSPDHGPPLVLSVGLSSDPGWLPLRAVDAGGSVVRLDDVDPARDCHTYPVTGSLSTFETERWLAALTEAWAIVGRDVPQLAATMDALITTITPLRPLSHARPRSATNRSAFGAVALSWAEPDVLAGMLVERVTKLILTAVCDMVELVDAGHADGWACVVALSEVFAGTASAQLALARMHAGRRVDGQALSMARDRLGHRLDALAGEEAWTDSGRSLLAGMGGRLERLKVDQ